jgi:mono/diheme cytochrome c family protein
MKTRIPFIFILILSACTAAHDPARDEGSTNPQAEIATLLAKPQEIDHAAVDRLVFKPSCVSCHGGIKKEDSVDLSTIESIESSPNERHLIWPGSARDSVIFATLTAPEGRRHMPPFDQPQLSADQIKLVELWIENGAKSGPDRKAKQILKRSEEIQPLLENPERIDYKAVRKLVFADSCLKCHSDHGSKPDDEAIGLGANLTDYASLFDFINPVVELGKPEESQLYKAIGIKKSMPPVRRGYPELGEDQIKLVRLWILNCAVEIVPAEDKLIKNSGNPEKVRNCD